MLDELKYYLDDRIPSERVLTICDCLEHSHTVFGIPVQDKLTDMLFSVVDLPTDEAVDLIVDYTVELAISAMAEFGITVNPDTAGPVQMGIYNEILYTALNVDQHEDPHRILALLEDVEDAEDGFAQIVEELTGQPSDITLDQLISVERDLIAHIQETSIEQVVAADALVAPDDTRLRDRAVHRVRHSPCYRREAPAECLLADTGLFGVSLTTLIDASWDVLGDLPPDILSDACYQLACASDVDDVSVCDSARHLADGIISDDQAVLKQQVARRLQDYPTPTSELTA